MIINKEIMYRKDDLLNIQDTEIQTYGCRYFNPEICRNYTYDTCAFVKKDKICTTPSKKWKLYYKELKKNSIDV